MNIWSSIQKYKNIIDFFPKNHQYPRIGKLNLIYFLFISQLRNLAFKKIPQKSSHAICNAQHELSLPNPVQKDSREENWQEWRQRDEQVHLSKSHYFAFFPMNLCIFKMAVHLNPGHHSSKEHRGWINSHVFAGFNKRSFFFLLEKQIETFIIFVSFGNSKKLFCEFLICLPFYK